MRRKSLPRRIDVVLFSAATAAILHCYSDAHGVHRDVFRSKCASRKPCGKLKFLVNLTSLVALPAAVCNAPLSCCPLSQAPHQGSAPAECRLSCCSDRSAAGCQQLPRVPLGPRPSYINAYPSTPFVKRNQADYPAVAGTSTCWTSFWATQVWQTALPMAGALRTLLLPSLACSAILTSSARVCNIQLPLASEIWNRKALPRPPPFLSQFNAGVPVLKSKVYKFQGWSAAASSTCRARGTCWARRCRAAWRRRPAAPPPTSATSWRSTPPSAARAPTPATAGRVNRKNDIQKCK